MPEGGILGYHCHHEYPISAQHSQILSDCLKGCDAALMSALQILGLQTDVFARWTQDSNNNKWIHEYGHISEDADEEATKRHRNTFWMWEGNHVFSKSHIKHCHDLGMECLELYGFPCKNPQDITWINSFRQEASSEATASIQYGNNPAEESFYSIGCILAVVPPFNERNSIEMEESENKRQKL